MRIKTFTAICFLLSIFPFTVSAEGKAPHYAFDKAHTSIIWFAGHKGYSKSMGQFMDFAGDVVLDSDNPAASSVEITIKTTSMTTGLADFDAHLKSPDFFNVAQYPTASFKSTKVIFHGNNKATVEGNFTLLGQTHPLVLDVVLNKRDTDMSAREVRAGFSAKTTVKRSKWGMKTYVPFISDDIDIIIETEIIKK